MTNLQKLFVLFLCLQGSCQDEREMTTKGFRNEKDGGDEKKGRNKGKEGNYHMQFYLKWFQTFLYALRIFSGGVSGSISNTYKHRNHDNHYH